MRSSVLMMQVWYLRSPFWVVQPRIGEFVGPIFFYRDETGARMHYEHLRDQLNLWSCRPSPDEIIVDDDAWVDFEDGFEIRETEDE